MKYREAVHAMESGDESAKTRVAFYKLTGRGRVDVDVAGAIVLLEQRVKEGDGDAMWMLGLCYEFGIGVEQNEEQAESLYAQSCNAENEIGDFMVWNSNYGRGTGLMNAGWKSLRHICQYEINISLVKRRCFDQGYRRKY